MGDVDAQDLGALPVEVEIDLRRRRAVRRVDAGQLGNALGRRDETARGRGHVGRRGAGAADELELEAGGCAEADDGWQVERDDGRGRNPAEILVELVKGREHRHAGSLAFVERLHRRHEEGAVGQVEAVEHAVAADGEEVLQPGLAADDALDLLDDGQGPARRCGIRQLDLAHEGALVFVGQKAGGYDACQPAGPGDEGQGEQPRDQCAARQRRGQADIAVAARIDSAVQARDDAPALAAMAQDEGAERRGQGQGVEGRDHHRGRHGHGELLVELAGDARNEGRRDEDRQQHQRDGDDRARHLAHGLFGGLCRCQVRFRLEDMLDRFDHDDRVVDHDADGEHQGQQRDCIGREAHGQHDGEGADQGNRHGDDRDDRGAEVAEKDEDDDADQDEGLEEGMDHRLDRRFDEHRGVVHDVVGDILGQQRIEFLQRLADALGRGERVGAGQQVDLDAGGRLAVVATDRVARLGPQLDPRHVLQPDDRALGVGADDDVLVFLYRRQAALGRDVEFEFDRAHQWGGADPADGGLDVLRLDRLHDVVGRHLQACQAVEREPGAHRVVERAEQHGIAHPRHAPQVVEHLDGGVVREELAVPAAFGRMDRHQLQQGRGLLLHRDAVALHFLRQAGGSLVDAVVHIDRIEIGIRSDGEAHRQRVAAVATRHRLHIDHALDAVDLGFDDLGHRRLDHGRRRAGIGRRHAYLRRDDVGELRHRKRRYRDQAGDRDDRRDDEGKARTANEDRGNGHRSGATAGRREVPARALRSCPDELSAGPGR